MTGTVRERTVDWTQVINDIRHAGFMVKAIAAKVGLSPQGLNELYVGRTKKPCYSVGDRLLKLREKVS